MSAGNSVFERQFIERLADAIADRISRSGGSDSKRLFTLEEAAEYLGRSVRSVEMLLHRGTIPVTKIDGKRQVDRSALDKIISDRTYFEV